MCHKVWPQGAKKKLQRHEKDQHLTLQQQETLLAFARAKIAEVLGAAKGSAMIQLPDDEVFQELGAVFVTLTNDGVLRGCIGSLQAVEPLKISVAKNAVQAAFKDPRFPPVKAEELPKLHVSISVLTPPKSLTYSHTESLLQALRPGVDGVILMGPGGARATFLPQVWHQLPEPAHFLSQLCRKAGLAADAWKTTHLHYQVYQTLSFAE